MHVGYQVQVEWGIKGLTLLHIVPFCERPNQKSEGFAKEKKKT
jgi:hypothetical protein